MTNDELSAEIARRLFGLVPHTNDCANPNRCFAVSANDKFGNPLAPYASDHNAAMGLVVPEMRKRGWELMTEDFIEEARCGVMFVKGRYVSRTLVPFGEEPRAICEAALAALDSEEAK